CGHEPDLRTVAPPGLPSRTRLSLYYLREEAFWQTVLRANREGQRLYGKSREPLSLAAVARIIRRGSAVAPAQEKDHVPESVAPGRPLAVRFSVSPRSGQGRAGGPAGSADPGTAPGSAGMARLSRSAHSPPGGVQDRGRVEDVRSQSASERPGPGSLQGLG